jgi:hypothetical protein
MKTRRYFASRTVALVASVLATLSLIACQKTQQQATPAPAVVSQVPSTEKVFIVFEGPWAFAPDPKDAAGVVAIAPKTKGHRDLFVKASNQSPLVAGAYLLSFPAHSGQAAATPDPAIAQADIDPSNLQRALDSKSARYVIRLPKPEEYRVAARSRSRFGAAYPPDASTEKDYATAVSLRYNVSTLNGFSLAGTPDSGVFNPLLLQVETPVIRFVILPTQFDDPADKCNTHSREGFRDLTTLLGLTLYVDFPDNPADCHGKDPQSARPAKAEGGSTLERLTAILYGNLVSVERSSALGGMDGVFFAGWNGATNGARSIAGYAAAAIYFFTMPQYDCAGPHILLRPTSAPPAP